MDIDGIFVPFYIESIRPKGSFSYLVKFDGIDSEFEARKLVNKTVFALRDKLREYMEENYDDEVAFFDDLIGCTVIDSVRGVIGKVADIDTNTENQLFIVNAPDGSVIYIPVAEDFIDDIDEDSKEIRMTLPEGLIDLNS